MTDCTTCQFKEEAERERAWHDRVLKSAQAIYGEDCVRYKLSLFKNGRARNHFPRDLDGHWFAFQRAENDGHMGLVAMLEAQKDEIERLSGMLEMVQMGRDDWLVAFRALQSAANAVLINGPTADLMAELRAAANSDTKSGGGNG